MLLASTDKYISRTKPLEQDQLAQFLRLLDETDQFEFPIDIQHRDRPDIVLSTSTRVIGLEVGSFPDEEFHQASDIHDTRLAHASITLSKLRDRTPRQESDEIFGELKGLTVGADGALQQILWGAHAPSRARFDALAETLMEPARQQSS